MAGTWYLTELGGVYPKLDESDRDDDVDWDALDDLGS